MVKLSYCPNCEKAYRFHLKRKFMCPECKEVFETIDVTRSKYFLIQFPFVLIGFIIVCFSVISMLTDNTRIFEPIGVFILGLALLLFGLALQFMDNSKMEQLGTEVGRNKFSTKIEKERISNEWSKERILTEQTKTATSKPIGKFEQVKLDQIIQKKDGSVKISKLFTKPNIQDRIVKFPKQYNDTEKPKQTQLSSKLKSKPTNKKARKIRKAL